MKFINKRNTFFFAVFCLCVAFLLNYLRGSYGISREVYKLIAEPLFNLSSALLLCSLMLFFVRDEVFGAWRKFALVWIPLSIFSIAITPNTTAILQVVDKEVISIVCAGLFVVISLILVIFKTYSLKGKK